MCTTWSATPCMPSRRDCPKTCSTIPTCTIHCAGTIKTERQDDIMTFCPAFECDHHVKTLLLLDVVKRHVIRPSLFQAYIVGERDYLVFSVKHSEGIVTLSSAMSNCSHSSRAAAVKVNRFALLTC